MADLSQIIGLLSGLQGFGKAAGIVIAVALALGYLRRNRFEEDKDLVERREKSNRNLQEESDRFRLLYLQQVDMNTRLIAALQWRDGRTHQERHNRINDRQNYVSYMVSKGIEPLMLPEPEQIPPVIELDENGHQVKE